MAHGSTVSLCQKCNYMIDDLPHALLHGCPKCHHRRVKFIKKTGSHIQKEQERGEQLDFFTAGESEGVGVGIKILDKGSFQVDLKALTENNESADPVIVQDKKGVINIILKSE